MAKKGEYQRVRWNSGHHLRILGVMVALSMVAFVPVAIRLYHLMVRSYDYYAALALRNQTRTTLVAADRGTIFDANMNILACSQPVQTLYLDPHELKQSKENIGDISRFLGGILNIDPVRIEQQASDTRLRYQKIAEQLSMELAAQIRSYIHEQDISGIHLEPGAKRLYPNASLAAQVIGFTNAEGVGCEGVEAAYNRFLAGSPGRVITTKGNNEMDMPFSYENYVASVPGCDVILTLDMTVQQILEKRMQEAISKYAVQNGAFGLVMNVKTGEILAMSTLGSYDPNAYLEIYDTKQGQEVEKLRLAALLHPEGSEAYENAKTAYREALQAARLKQWRNRCISDGYEPGSTFKVLTMAAALDSGAITLQNHFSCGGAAHIPGRSQLLHCWRSAGHGSQTTAQALQNSCNLAFANIALKLGGERFYDYVKEFGILEKTGIDLSGESKGVFFTKELVTNTDKWGTASLTSGSFGQTFKLTPLQLVRAISAVVNGGYLMEPYLVSEVVDAAGNTVLKQEPTVLRQVISEETSRTMCKLMESVVTEGTAKNAAVAGFSIGGKTGTSEKIDVLDENGKPTLDKIVSFVGVAPMDDPEYIVLVALDTPSRSTGLYISGGVMAAPTVGAVLSDLLPYFGVQQYHDPDDLTGKPVTMPDLNGKTKKEAGAILKELGLTGQIIGAEDNVTGQLPSAGQTVPGGSQVLLYCGEEAEVRIVKVPDFHRMTRQAACDTAGALGLYILAKGNQEVAPTVVVTGQSVAAGEEIPVGSTIELHFTDTDIRD